jgi:FAD/FMN-containing dehydrogenase
MPGTITRELDRLRETLAGDVLQPGTPAYEAARKPVMTRFWPVRPRAVIRCASAADVARALGAARRLGLPVVPRGGGHCFAGRSSTTGIVLDLSPLNSISAAPGGVATIGAGARLARVYDALHEHGLTLPAGCGPTVGIAGLTLGGGLGLLGRQYGLTCDRLLAAQVVLTDGRIVECDERREPDLFWALRGGGGGQFGVVTSLTFAAVPAPQPTRFELTWPLAAAAAVIAGWQRWAPDAPDELSASLKLTAADADGPAQVIGFGAMLGTPAETAALLGDLTRLAGVRPASRDLARQPYRDLKRALAGPEPRNPAGPVLSKSEFFRQALPDHAVTELLDLFGRDRIQGQQRELNFTPMGGAYNRVPPEATAFAHRAERFLLEHVTAAPARRRGRPGRQGGSSAVPDAAAQWVRRSWTAARPWASGRVYPNFPDPDLTDWPQAYHGGNYARLARVKRRYDPHRALHFHQSV